MGRERIPEHPDLVHERKETFAGLVLGFGIVLLVFGVITLAFAGTTEQMYASQGMPPDVKAAVASERLFAYGLLVAGGAVAAVGTAAWTFVRRPRDRVRE